ncbi:hypothetical protein AAV35_002645 [Salimicrobium jeotgali]|uniref:Pyrrolo-quinoline quinone n=1 Tax=Salimicrobium jeotgali TaxID=1230341 RepID=K2H664_9BACI|nr:PQQ-binding-like beta-propeller repeat protein [Salimicrobium jeotgali]AKG03793.1 hypothetical protein AAV35_002645 [Salimicrobium jeotgali]EKE31280.1 pyrrolo-quinoline quinone [Salimicrobium jeotgali]MBM7697092.1 outer membrane protein assembly factor BamB [Salimicrobium jeotgali]
MKKRVRNVMLSALFLTGSLMMTEQASAAKVGPEEWTEYRMNSENNPVYNSSFDEEIQDVIETNNQIRSTPVIVGNNAYIGNHESGDLYSYNLVEGTMNWEAKAPNWVHSEMIYAEDNLFVGFGNRYFKNETTRGTEESGVLSLDAETGETRWKFETDGEVMPTPAFHDGTVYIVAGDRHLYAVDAESGEEEWNLELGHVMSMSSPTIEDGMLYVGGGAPTPYTFTAVDLEKEEISWQTEFPEAYAGLDDVPPVIYEDSVITTALEGEEDDNPTHMIYAMNTDNGEMKWKDSLGQGEMVKNNKSGAPMIYEDQVFVASPITKSYYAYNASDGERNWKYEANVSKAPPVAENEVVYFTDKEGFVYAFDTETYELLGSKELGGVLAPSGPVLMNGTLIVGSQDSNVYALPTSDVRGSSDASFFWTSPLGITLFAATALLAVVLLFILRKRTVRKDPRRVGK